MNPNGETLSPRMEAQRIAFGPVLFQVIVALRDLGILRHIHLQGPSGCTTKDIASACNIAPYGVQVLLESAFGGGVVAFDHHETPARWTLTKVGEVLYRDPLTKVNIDFIADVCYEGLLDLQASIKSGRPEGLERLSHGGETVYRALPNLQEKCKASWFAFDHFYSDQVFTAALTVLLGRRPRQILDIGGNTGRMAARCRQLDPTVSVTIADLPEQINAAQQALKDLKTEGVSFYPIDLLSSKKELPKGFDAVWMSQFLVCFPPEDIIAILKEASRCLTPQGRLWILDTYWDTQTEEIAKFCLLQTSPYFTCIANGTSKIYSAADMGQMVSAAGLRVVECHDNLGFGHSLWGLVS